MNILGFVTEINALMNLLKIKVTRFSKQKLSFFLNRSVDYQCNSQRTSDHRTLGFFELNSILGTIFIGANFKSLRRSFKLCVHLYEHKHIYYYYQNQLMKTNNHKTVNSEAEKIKKFSLNETEIEESIRLRKLFSEKEVCSI